MTHLLLLIIYLSFISLGLPTALMGSAWPAMQIEFGVPVSYAGAVSMIISAGTMISSLLSDRLTRKLGTGKQTALSVAVTALSMFGFATSRSFWALCFWAVPYGLGAGSIDVALNNYVAHHYASRHMSWLHCMWGVGSAIGPYIMGFTLAANQGWNAGYFAIGILQVFLTVLLICSLPLWKKHAGTTCTHETAPSQPAGSVSIRQAVGVPGAKSMLIVFFCYCALEQTIGLWGSSYLVLQKNYSSEIAANFVSIYFIGVTVGRAMSGFLTFYLDNKSIIRLGLGIVGIGILLFLLPLGETATLAGFILLGLGGAPIHPCAIRSTPEYFGTEYSQVLIGIETASAYAGSCLMPPIFGLIVNHISITLLPAYLFLILAIMSLMHEKLMHKT